MKDLRGPVHFPYSLHLFKTLQNIFSFFRFTAVLRWHRGRQIFMEYHSPGMLAKEFQHIIGVKPPIYWVGTVLKSKETPSVTLPRFWTACSSSSHQVRDITALDAVLWGRKVCGDNKQNLMSCLWIYWTIRSDGLSLCPDEKCTNWSSLILSLWKRLQFMK